MTKSTSVIYSVDRRLDTNFINSDGDTIRVSYLPFLQMIVYTNITIGTGSEFVSATPDHDASTLKVEVMNHINLQNEMNQNENCTYA